MGILVLDILVGMLIISGISMAAVGLYARRFVGRVPAATPFIILMFCAAAWAILYALDLLAPTLPSRIAFHNLRFLFMPFFSVLELWLVLAYVNKTEWIRKDLTAIFLIIPVLSAALAITSPLHDLFRYNFFINTTGPIPVLGYTESIFYQLYTLYSLLLLLLAIGILIVESHRRGTLREMPTILLLVALAFPTLLNYITLYYAFPSPGLNLTPALLWIPAILYMIALFRYRFLDIIPIARGRLIEALSKPVLVLDINERIIDINPAAGELFCISPSRALGMGIGDLARDWPELISLCREKTTRRKDLDRQLSDGTHHFIGSVEPLSTPNGVLDGHLVFLQDVTELKRTEAALRESEEKYRTLVESSFDGIAIHQGGIIVYVNQTAARLMGAERPSHLEGMSTIDFVAPLFRQNAKQRIAQASEIPLGLVREQFIRMDGSIIDVDVSTVPTVWNGKPAAYVTFRDITAQVRAEGALRESEEKYRSIIEEMQDIFYRTDRSGRIVMLSPSAARLAGYVSNDELIGKNVLMLYSDPTDRDRLLAALTDKGSVDSFPVTLKVSDGSIRYVTTSSHYYRDTNGNVLGVEGVIHDITEQRRAEDSLRIANKKLNLLSSVTRHDIRNQLMALMAFLELSQEAIGNPEELADFLRKNQKIAENIARQITFTKDYEDLGVKAPSWQYVRSLIDRAVSLLPIKNIRIENEIDNLEIFADPLVEKVFYNLIDNSLRYGGASMSRIRISTRPSGASLVIVFEDDGTGIPDRDKAFIFDKGVGKNTGMGLYLSREILAVTGITISETGIFEKGARFEMLVPDGGFRFIS